MASIKLMPVMMDGCLIPYKLWSDGNTVILTVKVWAFFSFPTLTFLLLAPELLVYGKATHTELVQKGIIVASSSTFHQWMCTIVLLCACCFFSYFIDKCMLSVSPLLCGHALACGPSMAAIHQAFCAEYYLWCSDWLELLRWLTTHTPLLHTLSCCISVKAGAHLVSCSGWQQQVSWCMCRT